MSEAVFESWIPQVRARLASPAPARLPLKGRDDARQAAVLVPLYVDGGQLWTLLTKRAEELPHHRGQIAFPGGGRELGEDLWSAALREAEEEVGIDRRRVVRLGELDEVATPSGFRVVPCVGAMPFPCELVPNPGEIDEVFGTPLAELANPRLIEEREVLINGHRRRLRMYHVGRFLVWGMTARILQNLLSRLGVDNLYESEPAV